MVNNLDDVGVVDVPGDGIEDLLGDLLDKVVIEKQELLQYFKVLNNCNW